MVERTADGANAPNGGLTTNQYEVMSYVNDGTSETMTISVDLSAAYDGSAMVGCISTVSISRQYSGERSTSFVRSPLSSKDDDLSVENRG
ncbi:MAG: hypothetical protein IPP15_23385 [Saprospiraceae bacterium]|uniref:Uncharacterized protein n=1 Tax=Candidatus Opimibacter skivensis TaxID=2982028 RepID=A0A9D7T0Y9_9BACT|nr:hypothetical protein [Candidatus Opimibacter skivensis]